ncbi:MAG: helix-turn-helix transcriptional regulator [Theionarchaea archaeon]|nr:helix-turn-helix transcriptional regulator [Theionarchaea archaeon]
MEKQEIVKVIKDPKQLELFENPNYSRILGILRKGELTIKEIHRLFNKDYEDKKTLSTVYRYMEKLLENDLVFVSREELKKKHLIESYYRRTALFFTFEDKRSEKDVITATSKLLQDMYNLSEDKGKTLTELINQFSTHVYQCDRDFYEKHGEKILALEREYGFDIMKVAIKTVDELLYFKRNPELLEKIYEILEG